jgi:hypothetical protein
MLCLVVDVPLLRGTRPRRLAAITYQSPTLLTAVIEAGPRYIAPARIAQKTCLPLLRFLSCSLVPELFTSNGCCTVACLRSCYLVMDLHAPVLCAQDKYMSALTWQLQLTHSLRMKCVS